MANKSPYRSLSADRRVALVTHDISRNRDSRDGYIRSIVSRGGGFRPEKLRKWPAEQLAREVVRYSLETPHDELGLLIALYLEVEPAIQIAFLDAAGVPHENGSIAESLPTPYTDADTVRSAAERLITQHGDEARHYLATIAFYNGEAWPGLGEMVGSGER